MSKRLSTGRAGVPVAGVCALLSGVVCAFAAEPVAVVADSANVFFEDVTSESGVDFVHWNGMSGRFYYPEVVGSGGALFDYDNDGDLDLFLVQGALLGPDRESADATFAPPVGEVRDRVYRNDGVGPGGAPRFVDVTSESGIDSRGYGMGAAVADYDGDGFVDLLVTNFGRDELWRNRGDGTFEERSAPAGLVRDSWSSSASFVDYDLDGLPDLLIVNYLDWSFANHKSCMTERGEIDYCAPTSFPPTSDRLYRNEGDGTFRDVSTSSGIASVKGAGLGVVATDFNGDGRPDFYVANDLTPNLLWLNAGDGRFEDDAVFAGAALSREGKAESSMGVDAADLDADGDVDLFMTHYHRETNTVYLNDGQGLFRDTSEESGLGGPSWEYTAWGTGFLDFDLDSRLDLLVVNGAVTLPPGADRGRDTFPLDEPNQLFRNLGDGRFADVSRLAGAALTQSEVSRGALLGDLDNDGDIDVVVTNNSGPARVLLGKADVSLPWIGLRLVGDDDPPRDLVGARVAVAGDGGTMLWRRSRTDGSYASGSDPRVLVALGGRRDDSGPRSVVVTWPGGARERFDGVALRRYTALEKGRGEALQ